MAQRVLWTAFVAFLLLTPAVSAHAEMPADCARADAVVSGKVRALMRRSDTEATWLLGNSIAAIKRARAQCVAGRHERALLRYGRILLYMDAREVALNEDGLTRSSWCNRLRARQLQRGRLSPIGRGTTNHCRGTCSQNGRSPTYGQHRSKIPRALAAMAFAEGPWASRNCAAGPAGSMLRMKLMSPCR